jgi:phosphate-selective porin OprO/OprP
MQATIRTLRLAAAVTIALGNIVATAPSVAAEDDRLSALEARLEALDQEVRVLKRQLELERETASTKAKDAAVVTASKDGFSLASPDKNFQLKVRGYIHADGRFFVDDEPANSTFVTRRARPIIDGTVWNQYEFRLMPDFGNGSATLVDAYVDGKFSKLANVRVGKFKEPFQLERLQSVTDDPFIELGLPVNLSPNRDVGVQLSGDVLDGGLSYAVGVFNGVADGGSADVDTDDDKDVVARLFAHPFKSTDVTNPLQGLGVGVAGTFGHQEGTPGVYRTPAQQTFFSYSSTVAADGRHTRVSPQAYYYYGPLGVLSEYVWSDQELERAGVIGDFDASAFQVAANYVLTGEDNSYTGIKVKEPFSWKDGTWGALEAKARYGFLRIDKDAFNTFASPSTAAQRADELTLGLNWHLSKNVKWMTDYEHTTFNRGALDGDREDESAVLTRVQLVY